DIPFWVKPYVDMRGVPVGKYQNNNISLIETELTYNVYNRWYLKAFTGIGNAYTNFNEFADGNSVRSIGTGFRYEIARALGFHMGMDFAWSNEDFGFYIVAGHAWLR
ncbi:MAG: BamA/TamA family outer membrane protein, partial [Flavobacteriaceae bacterium]